MRVDMNVDICVLIRMLICVCVYMCACMRMYVQNMSIVSR